MVGIKIQALQKRLTKLDKDLEELRRDGNQTWALEQYRRKELIKKVCDKYGNPDEFQKVESFIMDPKSETIYCYNHKAGSSTWMAAYSELVDDIKFVRMARKTHNYYKVKEKLAPGSTRKVLESDYFTFTVVRHPFDRVLSAFRDRILRGCAHQAKKHIPRILGRAELKYDEKGCVTAFPTFRQFVEYITSDRGKDGDPHWLRYSAACAPCLVSYDAIVKLETSEEDEKYVLEKSGLGRYYKSLGRLNPSSGSTWDSKREHFSTLPCDTLELLLRNYEEDFLMFGYDALPFFKLCKKEDTDIFVRHIQSDSGGRVPWLG